MEVRTALADGIRKGGASEYPLQVRSGHSNRDSGTARLWKVGDSVEGVEEKRLMLARLRQVLY
jgi:hypothetical protein